MARNSGSGPDRNREADSVTGGVPTGYSSMASIDGGGLTSTGPGPDPRDGGGFWRNFPAMGDRVSLEAVGEVLFAPAGERQLKTLLAFTLAQLRYGGAVDAAISDAEDTLQDFLIMRGPRVLELYRHPRPFWPYFAACLKYHSLAFAKRLKNRGVHLAPAGLAPISSTPLDVLVDPAPAADARVEKEESEAAIRMAVERLDDPYRDVMRLVLAGVDNATIAQRLSIDRGLVKVRHFRARQMLAIDISLRIQTVGPLEESDILDFPVLCSALQHVAEALPPDAKAVVKRGADRTVPLSDPEKRVLLRALERTIQVLQAKVRRLPAAARVRPRRARLTSHPRADEEQLSLEIMMDALAPILARSK